MAHYFQTPDSAVELRTIRATIWGEEFEFTTANGVFSATRLDLGTSVLLREVPPPVHAGRVLDLGCGFGPIGVSIAKHCPTTFVDAVDVNDRALELTRMNARRHGVADRVNAGRPEGFATAVYDEIWSNPPIRIGKAALHEMLATWIPRLTRDGVAWLVVGKNLGSDSLQRWLNDQGFNTVKHASAKGFRVLKLTLN